MSPNKDVDGFHPFNLGLLFEGNQILYPVRQMEFLEILKYYNIKTTSKNIVIIGRSNIVGKPMFLYYLKILNSEMLLKLYVIQKQKTLVVIQKNADILIVAVGLPIW